MVAIIDYGMGNLRSVQKAFLSFGEQAVITDDKKVIDGASHIVLPGVGAFKSGIQNLTEQGLDEAIYSQVKKGKPLLGICLGMQMLLSKSQEGGECSGLDLIEGSVEKFNISLKIPHMGWNEIECREDSIFCSKSETVYFVHSYYCKAEPQNILATTNYGIDFTSAIKKDNVYGFQFHPEKSGEAGLRMLKNFTSLK